MTTQISSSELTFRLFSPEDALAAAKVNVLAFPFGDGSAARRSERILQHHGNDDRDSWILERNGTHVGQYTSLHLTGWLGGYATRVAGLAGVAVAPEARRQGIAGALVLDHLRKSRDNGVSWSMLYPFATSFYAHFGWAPAARRTRWRIPPAALPVPSTRSDGPTIRRFDPQKPCDLLALHGAYDAYCVRTNGSLSRSAVDFAAGFADDRTYAVGVVRSEHSVSGYLKATVVATQRRPITLVVTEFVALDDAAHGALLGFLAAQADQIDFIELDTPVDDPIAGLLTLPLPDAERLDEPFEHHYLGRMFQGMMARVVDLASALRTRGYPDAPFSAAASLTISARDQWLPDNERPVRLTLDYQGAHVTDQLGSEDAVHLSGPIEEISRILVGGTTLHTSVRFGRVSLSKGGSPADATTVDEWSRALGLPVPYPLVIF